MRAYRARLTERAAPRGYAFDREALIAGERGRVCLEKILTPPEDTPQASWLVISRWAGHLAAGSVITVSEKRLVVLRVRPMDGRRMVAHILCQDAAASVRPETPIPMQPVPCGSISKTTSLAPRSGALHSSISNSI
jgi:hypothetical protein